MARSGQITAQDALEQTRHQLGYQAIQSFYGVILLRSSPTSRREEIGALEEALRIAQRKFRAGSATKFDVLTTQVRLANAQEPPDRHALSQLEKQENGLRQLLGLRPRLAPRDRRGTSTRTRPAIAETVAIADGLLNRPEMKLARDDEQTARLRLDAADRGNRPTLDAQVTGGVENGVVPEPLRQQGLCHRGPLSCRCRSSPGGGFSETGMEAGAGVRSAQARMSASSIDSITTDVADAYSDLTAARARLANADLLSTRPRRPWPLRRRATRTASSRISSSWTPRVPPGRPSSAGCRPAMTASSPARRSPARRASLPSNSRTRRRGLKSRAVDAAASP